MSLRSLSVSDAALVSTRAVGGSVDGSAADTEVGIGSDGRNANGIMPGSLGCGKGGKQALPRSGKAANSGATFSNGGGIEGGVIATRGGEGRCGV